MPQHMCESQRTTLLSGLSSHLYVVPKMDAGFSGQVLYLLSHLSQPRHDF